MVRRGQISGVITVLGVLVGAGPVLAADADPCAAPAEARGVPAQLRVTAKLDQDRGWLVAEFGDLRINKFTSRSGSAVVEFMHGDDTVVFEFSAAGADVTRQGRRQRLGAGDQPAAVQRLLGDSPALYHTRMMLSQLEQASALKGPEMSVLSAAAFAASITGDAFAPVRLSERFVTKHQGVLRQVRFDGNQSCWNAYSTEVTQAQDDLMACYVEAMDSWLPAIKRDLCSIAWIVRVEAAWFELLRCTGTLSLLPYVG